MVHKMKLRNEPFLKIKNRTKTIEMRLYDEKRAVISIGDVIEFTDTSTNERLECIVTNLFKYENFDELYKHHSKITIGYNEYEIANPNDMLTYYTVENIKKYGVVGIEVCVKN